MSWLLKTIARVGEELQGGPEEEEEDREDDEEDEEEDEGRRNHEHHEQRQQGQEMQEQLSYHKEGPSGQSAESEAAEQARGWGGRGGGGGAVGGAGVGEKSSSGSGSSNSGVRGDLSELQRSLRSGFRGMASFLVGEPPPSAAPAARDKSKPGLGGAAAAARDAGAGATGADMAPAADAAAGVEQRPGTAGYSSSDVSSSGSRYISMGDESAAATAALGVHELAVTGTAPAGGAAASGSVAATLVAVDADAEVGEEGDPSTRGLSRDELRSLRWRQELEKQAARERGDGAGGGAAGVGGSVLMGTGLAPAGAGAEAEVASTSAAEGQWVEEGAGTREVRTGFGRGEEEEEEVEEGEEASGAGKAKAKVKVKGMKEDIAELSKRVKSGLLGLSSVIRVVRGDDLVDKAKGAEGEELQDVGEKPGLLPEAGAEGWEGMEDVREEAAGSDEVRASEREEEEEDEVDEEESDGTQSESLLAAAREDMKAISGTLASGISGLSSFATRFLAAAGTEWKEGDEAGLGTRVGGRDEGDDEEEEDEEARSILGPAGGVSEEIVSFAFDLSLHPETWIDFPLPDEEDEPEDFQLSAAQEEHVEALEMRVPRLVALRLELTPAYMSDNRFWKIYFVLLHARLPPDLAAVLSTPEILAVRRKVIQSLQEGQGEGVASTGLTAAAAASVVEALGPDAVAHVGLPVATAAGAAAAEVDRGDAGPSADKGAVGHCKGVAGEVLETPGVSDVQATESARAAAKGGAEAATADGALTAREVVQLSSALTADGARQPPVGTGAETAVPSPAAVAASAPAGPAAETSSGGLAASTAASSDAGRVESFVQGKTASDAAGSKDAEKQSGVVGVQEKEGKEELEADDWLNEDDDDVGVASSLAAAAAAMAAAGVGDDDLSFSDLEDDDDDDEVGSSSNKGKGAQTSAGGSGPQGGKPDAGQAVGASSPSEGKVAGGGGGGGSGGAAGGGVGEWVELKDGTSSGSDNHSADWQTVEDDDLA